MQRQRKQSGYIYQRAGWWVLRYREDLLENGVVTRRQLAKKIEPVAPEHKRCKRPPAEIQKKAEQLLRPLNNHSYTPEATQTLAQFVEGVYFPNISNEKRESTLKGYRARWESQLKARCGHLRLRDFRTCDGQKLLADIARQDATLMRSTLRHLRSLLSGIFKHAIQQGYLNGPNPIREVGTPGAPEGKETYAYSLEEVLAIRQCLSDPAKTIVTVAGFTGLRRAELRGLLWENYNGSELSVSRSIWEGYVNQPKTRKSKAPVPVIPALAAILNEYRELCGNPTAGPMFANGKGRPANLNNTLNREILPALNRCVCGKIRRAHLEAELGHEFKRDDKLPKWHGWHAFRRGLATNLYRLGVSDKIIQAILRHANVSTTMNIYVKTVSEDSIVAMHKLDSVLCANRALDATTGNRPLVN
jgi:integrase